MDPGCVEILKIVKACNAEGREICQKDIFGMNLAAPPTIAKRINDMLEDGDLLGTYVQTPHGTKRLLFVPEHYSTADTIVMHHLLGITNYQLRRIADALEEANGRKPTETRSDGHVQVALWDETEVERCRTSARGAGAPTSSKTDGASSAPNAGPRSPSSTSRSIIRSSDRGTRHDR